MRQRPRLAFAATAVGLLAAVSGCAGGPVRADSQPAIPATTTPSPSVDRTVTGTYRPLAAPTGEPSRPPSSPARPPAVPGFHSSVAPVTAAALPYSYRAGCPVPPEQLRLLHLRFWGFDATSHVGVLVVNAAVVPAVLAIFRELYDARFPIRRMELVDAFHASDPDSMAADNTSAFNCRYAVAPGPPQWSAHAYGEAIDVDPVENPYLEGGKVQPPDGAGYVNRGDVRPGMAVPGGTLPAAFAANGWYWGGRWTSSPDYQHFSSTGG